MKSGQIDGARNQKRPQAFWGGGIEEGSYRLGMKPFEPSPAYVGDISNSTSNEK